MFTGIVRDTGEIVRVEDIAGMRRVLIRSRLDQERMEIGASVCCDGCCLTVVEKGGDCFTVEVSGETLDKTMLGGWVAGTRVNLEPSLRLGDEMGGHVVTGHVDGTAVLESIKPDGGSFRLAFRVPDDLASYLAPKGSVSVNGISLTVNEVEGCWFGVNIIPHTWNVTNISQLQEKDKVNFEVDMLARYVARIIGKEREAA